MSEISWKDISNLLENWKNSRKLKIPELGTLKINIDKEEFENIGYLAYVYMTKKPSNNYDCSKEKRQR